MLKDRPGSWNLADWLCVGESPPKELVHTFYYGLCACIVSRAAGVLGMAEEEKRYADLSARVQAAFDRKFLDLDARRFGDGRCGADVFGLALGGLPADQQSAVANAYADRILTENGGHLDTGFLATSMLFDVLSDAGRDDVAFTIMNQRTYPSYGYWIAQGATTLWESWNGPAGVSRNHPALGSGVKWLYKGLAGLQIDPAKPGYEHVIIRPRMVGGVTQCSYHIKTQRGRFGVEWEKSESRVTIKVVIPVNSSATVYVPARSAVDVTESGTPVERTDGVEFLRMDDGCSVYDVGSGSYCFVAGA